MDSVANPADSSRHLNSMTIARARFWIEIVGLVSSVACVLAVFLALCLATLGGTESAASDRFEANETGNTPSPQSAAIPVSYVSDPSSLVQTSLVQTSLVQNSPAQSYEGIITDTHCGAKHSAKIGLSAGDCTRACVHAGDSFALVDGDKVFILAGESEALKRSAGERVKVVGTLNGNSISVSSVSNP